MSKVFSVRVPDDVGEWIEAYAAERDVKASALLSQAIVNFKEDSEGGVPDLEPQQSSVKTDRGVGVCPKREDGLGHVWVSWRVDPYRSCIHCGTHGREPAVNSGVDGPKGGGFFAQATRERSELFSKLRQPASVKVWGKA